MIELCEKLHKMGLRIAHDTLNALLVHATKAK